MIKEKSKKIKELSTYILFVLIIVVSIYLKLIKYNNPYIGLHGWNEAHWASLGRSVANGHILPTREFGEVDWAVPPIYSWMLGLFFILFGVSESSSRILNIIFSTITLCLLYLVCRETYDTKTALLAFFFASITPLCVYFGRNTGLESPMMFFAMSGLLSFIRWKKLHIKKYLFLAAVLFGIGIATRYLLLVILAPLLIAQGINFLKSKNYKDFFFFYIITCAPFVSWIIFVALNGGLNEITNYAAIPSIIGGSVSRKSPFNLLLIFQPFFYVKLFGFMLNEITIPLIILCLWGFLADSPSERNSSIYLFSAGTFLVLLVFPLAAYIHDYYQYALAHTVAIFASVGLLSTFEKIAKPQFKKHAAIVVICLICIASAEAIGKLNTLYSIEDGYVSFKISTYLKQLTPPDECIIVSDGIAAYYSERNAYVWLELYDKYTASQVIEFLKFKRPKYIIYPRWEKDLGLITDPNLFKYIYSHYHSIADIDNALLFEYGEEWEVDFKSKYIDTCAWSFVNPSVINVLQDINGLKILIKPGSSRSGGVISIPIFYDDEQISLQVDIKDVHWPEQGFANWFVAIGENSSTYIGVNNWNKGKNLRLVQSKSGIIEDLWVSAEGDWNKGTVILNKKVNTFEVYMNGSLLVSKNVDNFNMQHVRVLLGVYIHSPNEEDAFVIFSSVKLNKG